MPAWLINRLAEGKPLAFVQRLEKVAAKWDGQAKTTKGVPYDGGGFGEHGIGWIGFSLAYSKMRVIPVLDIDDGIWYRCRWVERRAVLCYYTALPLQRSTSIPLQCGRRATFGSKSFTCLAHGASRVREEPHNTHCNMHYQGIHCVQ